MATFKRKSDGGEVKFAIRWTGNNLVHVCSKLKRDCSALTPSGSLTFEVELGEKVMTVPIGDVIVEDESGIRLLTLDQFHAEIEICQA